MVTEEVAYLKLSCIADIPFEKNDPTNTIVVDQSLDFWARSEAVEADRKELNSAMVHKGKIKIKRYEAVVP
ncbi:hypothetical protein AbraIFM66951_009518 [Aspergillus brasiliensis]|nr:hypothetical protein AbraIFM66951_009518 [Aspergillus brasiliensis]